MFSGTTCEAKADFGSSLRLLGASVLDSGGVDITSSVSITSGSGFDYLPGVSPHVSNVPLPAGFLLSLTGLAGFGVLAHRQKKAA